MYLSTLLKLRQIEGLNIKVAHKKIDRWKYVSPDAKKLHHSNEVFCTV